VAAAALLPAQSLYSSHASRRLSGEESSLSMSLLFHYGFRVCFNRGHSGTVPEALVLLPRLAHG